MKLLKKLLPIIGLLYFGLSAFGAKRGVSFESTTTNVQEVVHIKVHSITNLAGTASTLAGYDANKKLGSISTGAGVTNSGGVLSGNYTAGTNVVLVTNANGSVSINTPVEEGVEGSQTPLLQDVDGDGNSITNLSLIEAEEFRVGTIIWSNAPSATLLKTDGDGVMTNAVEGVDYESPVSTNTTSNKTIDAANNVLKFTDYKDFVYPSRVDGTGCTIVTNSYTDNTWGLATYSGSADTNGNYAIFRVGTVPYDLDTSAAMTLKGLSFRVAGTDTDAAQFTIALYTPSSSGAGMPSDFTACSTFINFDSGSLTSPASGDVFFCSDVTLTGWAAALTAGRPYIISIARRNGSNDDAVSIVSGTIEYGRTK